MRIYDIKSHHWCKIYQMHILLDKIMFFVKKSMAVIWNIQIAEGWQHATHLEWFTGTLLMNNQKREQALSFNFRLGQTF